MAGGGSVAAAVGPVGLAPLDNPAPGGPMSIGGRPPGPAAIKRGPASSRPAAIAPLGGRDVRVSGRPRIPVLDTRRVIP